MADTGVQTILRLLGRRKRPVNVIAVDGHSAAGKSTFATALADRIGAVVVSGDDFYRVLDEAERAVLTPSQGADLYYDWQRLRDQALSPLRAGKAARFHPYDWHANQLADREIILRPSPYVVVEGLFVSRPQLADLVDVAVLVTSRASLRDRRQLERKDYAGHFYRVLP